MDSVSGSNVIGRFNRIEISAVFLADCLAWPSHTARPVERMMLKTRIALLAVGTVVLLAANAHAGTRVFVQIGAPVPVFVPGPPPVPVIVAARPAPYGFVWRPAHYVWTGYGYRMVPAAWVRPPYARAVWVAPRYIARPHRSVWVGGYWRR